MLSLGSPESAGCMSFIGKRPEIRYVLKGKTLGSRVGQEPQKSEIDVAHPVFADTIFEGVKMEGSK
jgi:hypothetical protein